MMTPYISTPVIFQQGLPPWAVQTPETTPVLWDRTPAHDGRHIEQEASAGKVISKDLIRSVCEPYFEQMLVAVQQAVNTQGQQEFQQRGPSWNPLPPTSMGQQGQGSSEEASTFEGEGSDTEGGAFSCIFTPHSNPVVTEEDFERVSNARTKVPEELEVRSETTEVPSVPQPQAMVCRHWKSKGWCRMERNCKFMHPENKCGIGFVNGKPGGASSNGDMNDSIAHVSSDQSLAATIDGKKKTSSAKKRKNKSKAGASQENLPLPQLLNMQPAGVA